MQHYLLLLVAVPRAPRIQHCSPFDTDKARNGTGTELSFGTDRSAGPESIGDSEDVQRRFDLQVIL